MDAAIEAIGHAGSQISRTGPQCTVWNMSVSAPFDYCGHGDQWSFSPVHGPVNSLGAGTFCIKMRPGLVCLVPVFFWGFWSVALL
jgi:hypothetical protein